MTNAPERTPLSERVRWDNCICGKGNPNGIGQSGDDWDLDTQCAYCDDADEVAALEQGRAAWEKDCHFYKHHYKEALAEVERLRAAMKENPHKLSCESWAAYEKGVNYPCECRALTKPEGE